MKFEARRVSVKQRAGVKLSSVKSKSDNMWALKYPFNPKNEKWPCGEKASSPSIDFEGNQATRTCSEADRLLFDSSTKVTIGDDAKARFWHSSWLDGEAPKYLAPHLFDLVRRKNKSVQQKLQNYS
jgi:hypothetical protein